nr:MAG TPA: hypothetical protein [Bacteriophage sp.]
MNVVTVKCNAYNNVAELFTNTRTLESSKGKEIYARDAFVIARFADKASEFVTSIIIDIDGNEYVSSSLDVAETLGTLIAEPVDGVLKLKAAEGRRDGKTELFLYRCDRPFIPQMIAKGLCVFE